MALGVLLGFLVLCSCSAPWTVVPISSNNADEPAQDKPFNAEAYVDSIWSSKVLPAVATQSVDLKEALAAFHADPAAAARRFGNHNSSGPACFLVKGEGKVLRVDTRSLAGQALLDLPPYDGHADAALQVGPVLNGTALRDALPFIQFSQFVNQLQFAGVGNALNSRVVKATLAGLPLKSMRGRVVSFAGAVSMPADDGLPAVVPVTLTIAGGAR